MSFKENFVCGICKKILKKPVSVPCSCSQICKEHVNYEQQHNKKTSMTCPTCKESYDIPEVGFCEMKKIQEFIKKKFHLSDKEKEANNDLRESLDELDDLNCQLQNILTQFPLTISNHFEEIRRNVDIRRETLIQTIHEISDDMIKGIEAYETSYTSSIRDDIKLNTKKEFKNLVETFRDPKLSWSTIETLRNDLNTKKSMLLNKLNDLEYLSEELNHLEFETSFDFDNDSFGHFGIASFSNHNKRYSSK